MVAAVDAVRNRDSGEPPAATTELENRSEITATLTELGARGELVLHQEDCLIRRLALPTLEQVGRDSGGCRPRGAAAPDASRPDGTLTLSRNDQVVTETGALLIGRQELERAARLHPAIPDRSGRVRALVEGVAWISNTRAAVAISPRLRGVDLGPVGTIAFFENGRLLPTTQPQFRVTGGPLAASPRGTYVTQTADIILRRNGSLLGLPRHLQDARALAWSPDERFLAVATPFAVTIVDVASLIRFVRIGSGLRSVTLPLSVTELAWR